MEDYLEIVTEISDKVTLIQKIPRVYVILEGIIRLRDEKLWVKNQLQNINFQNINSRSYGSVIVDLKQVQREKQINILMKIRKPKNWQPKNKSTNG